MKRLIEQLLKFGVVGAIALLIDFGLMVLLTELFGLNPILSAAISFTVSLICNYLLSMRFVFSRRDDLSRRREFVIFVVLALIGLGINELIMWLGDVTLNAAGIDYAHSNLYMAVKIFASAVVSLWNFFSRKRWLDSGL